MAFQKTLVSFGLSEPEAAVYGALLEAGATPVAGIAKMAGLKRTHAYFVINSLIEKGLAEQVERGKKSCFQLASPVALQEFVDRQRSAVEESKRTLDAVLPGLLAAYMQSSERPVIQFGVGVAGLKRIYDDVIALKKPLCVFASRFDRDLPELDALIRSQIRKQHDAGIEVRALVGYADPTMRSEFAEYAKSNNVGMRAVKNFMLPAQVLCYGNSVAISTLKTELTNARIEHKDIAESVRLIFEALWAVAEKI